MSEDPNCCHFITGVKDVQLTTLAKIVTSQSSHEFHWQSHTLEGFNKSTLL